MTAPLIPLRGGDWHRRLQGNVPTATTEGEDFVFVAIVLILLCISCIALNPIRRCHQCLHRGEDTAEAREQRLRDALRPSSVTTVYMSDDDRRSYLSNLLVNKKVFTRGSKHDTVIRKFHNMVIPRLSSSLHSAADDELVEPCSICLNEYKEGDEICWSHNKHCDHYFHRQCITEWLMRHDECPICRQDFLSLEDLDFEVQTETQHSTQPREQVPEQAPATNTANVDTPRMETPTVTNQFRISSMFQRSRLTSPIPRPGTEQPTLGDNLELAESDRVDMRPREPSIHGDPSSMNEPDSNDVMEDVEAGNNEDPAVASEPQAVLVA